MVSSLASVRSNMVLWAVSLWLCRCSCESGANSERLKDSVGRSVDETRFAYRAHYTVALRSARKWRTPLKWVSGLPSAEGRSGFYPVSSGYLRPGDLGCGLECTRDDDASTSNRRSYSQGVMPWGGTCGWRVMSTNYGRFCCFDGRSHCGGAMDPRQEFCV